MMVKFSDVFIDETKKGFKIHASNYLQIGRYPIIDQGQSDIAGYTNLENGVFNNIPAIIFGDHTRIIKYIDKPFFLGADGVKILKSKIEDVNYKYLYYCLLNAKIPNTGYNRHFKWLKQLEIPLPSLEEQRKIAETLDKVSDLIAKRKQQLEKLDLFVKSRFVEMFEDNDYNYQDLISLIIDGMGLSYGIVQPGEDGTGDMGVIRPVDIFNGKILKNQIKYIDRQIGLNYSKTELSGSEILITVRGTTGLTALTTNEFIGMNVTRGIAVIRYNSNKINPIYLNEYLKCDKSQRYIQENTKGATLKQINLSELRKLMVLVPPLELQKQFADFVQQIEKTKTIVIKSLEKLETLKKALMQEYFG